MATAATIQHHEVLLIRHIRSLLYEQGFTIGGARRLGDARDTPHDRSAAVLSGAEMQALRNELGNVSAMLERWASSPARRLAMRRQHSILRRVRAGWSACARAVLVSARCLPAIRLPCFEVSVA